MDLTHSQANCRLCGDPAALLSPDAERIDLDWYTEPQDLEQKLCGGHIYEFWIWNRGGWPERRQVTPEAFDHWVARIIQKLSRNSLGVHRCEVITPASGRCVRFADITWSDHYVCARHGAQLLRGRPKAYPFDSEQGDATLRVRRLVAELLSH